MKVVLQNLTKKFPGRGKKNAGEVTAVSGLTFEIPDGELVGLLGPSGCGKSTALNLISGLLKPTAGRIFFGEDDITDLPPENRGVGLVFQNYALYPHLTVKQNILFPLQNLKGKDKLSKAVMLSKANEAARLVQIDELMDRKPGELSGGQQQRVAIARALAGKPSILLADEPTGNLDSRTSQDVIAFLKASNQRFQQTMVMITHNPEIAQMADRIIRIEDGRIKTSVSGYAEDEHAKMSDPKTADQESPADMQTRSAAAGRTETSRTEASRGKSASGHPMEGGAKQCSR